jgi:hypothetical protein
MEARNFSEADLLACDSRQGRASLTDYWGAMTTFFSVDKPVTVAAKGGSPLPIPAGKVKLNWNIPGELNPTNVGCTGSCWSSKLARYAESRT